MEDLYEKNKVKILRLYLYTKYTAKHSQDKGNSNDTPLATTSEVTENDRNVITIDLPSRQESKVILLDEEISKEVLHDYIKDEADKQGRGLHAEEIRPDLETPEMTTESNSIGQEGQGAYVMDVIFEAQAGEMLLNNSNDSEVMFGVLPSDPFDLDDTLPWGGSKPKIISVVRRGINKQVLIRRNLPDGKVEEWKDCQY